MSNIKSKLRTATVLSILAVCVGLGGYYAYNVVTTYNSGHSIETDKTANVNVMLTRPEGWQKITTSTIHLTKEDFSQIDGSTATIPITAELARQFCDAADEDIDSYIDHNTTHYAYMNLINTSDPHTTAEKMKKLIFVTEPSQEERDYAASKGVSLEIDPVAKDGFVFITHKDNPVTNLTTEQIQGIYSGEITNWKEVGGNDAEIVAYQREPNSGSQTAMENMVMKDKPLVAMEGYRIVEGMGHLIEVIAEYENRENSIGYTYYYYINNLYRNDDIKVLSIDGVSPDNENLINGTYPYTTAYYAVMKENSVGRYHDLRDYLLTDEWQQIVKLAGYCPVREVD